jgi:nucleoside-diphosphate-sugar epimerase
VVARARAGRLPRLGSGAALIDTTYVDNAAAALVAAVDACEGAHGRAVVVSNGEPRTVLEVLTRVCRAAGVAGPSLGLPRWAGLAAGAAAEAAWVAMRRRDTPPLTRFLVEQLTTAHWFDQRETRRVLGWTPHVPLDTGFERLAQWYEAHPLDPLGGPAGG